MAFTPTTNLSLPLIDTGTESGTWGEVVDNGLTSYLDIAIAGGLAITITSADVTLTKTAGTNTVTNIGATTAQYAILNISGAKTAARNLNLPISSKYYVINNAGTGGFLLTVRGVTPTTGVTLQDGEKAIVAWNGTDYVKVAGLSQTNNVSYTSFLTETSTTLINKPTLQFQRSGAQTAGTGNNGFVSFQTNGPGAIGTYEAGKIDVTFRNVGTTVGVGRVVLASGNNTGSFQHSIVLDSGVTVTGIVTNTSGYVAWENSLGQTARITQDGAWSFGDTAGSATGTAGQILTSAGSSTNPAWGGGAATTPVVVTFSATAMTVNCLLSNVFTTTFTANVTIAPTISNPINGQTINWFITQDATGSRTVTWPASFKWAGGVAQSLSTGANSVDLLVATYRSTTGFWYASLSKAFA